MGEKKYIALVFESDIARRGRLKTAAVAANVFERVDVSATADEALLRLSRTHADTDIIFISGLLSSEDQEKFVKAARATKCGAAAAFVSVQKRTDQNDSEIAAGLVRGVDGVLWEPFSVSSVVSTAAIADRIKAADIIARKRAAATLLVNEALFEVDEVGRSSLSGDDERYRLGLQKLRKVGHDLRQFAKESEPLFIEICRTRLSTANAQTMQVYRQPYGGVSVRVQRMLDKRRSAS